jgi:hypothetical protein
MFRNGLRKESFRPVDGVPNPTPDLFPGGLVQSPELGLVHGPDSPRHLASVPE